MATIEWVELVVSLAGVLGSVCLVAVAIIRLRRSPSDKTAALVYGYVATFGLLIGIVSCLGIVLVLGAYVGSSWPAAAAVVAANLLVQPLALLLCFVGVRKIVLGVGGHVAHGWRRIRDEELAGLAPAQRRSLSRYCVFQGLIALPFGACLSIALASPLVR